MGMEMLKLLIADGTEEFRLALTEQLAGSFVIRCCHQGKQALEMIGSFRPDVLVLDLMLPGLDGISLLQAVEELGLKPMVLAMTRFVSPYVMEAMDRFGVGYLMIKPCDVNATLARIRDLSRRHSSPALPAPDIRTTVSNVLLHLGTLAAHVDGGVPVITMDMGELNDEKMGEMFYFFELACGISAYMLGVNPFNQPGVEFYKRNMFQLLGKPGYEA